VLAPPFVSQSPSGWQPHLAHSAQRGIRATLGAHAASLGEQSGSRLGARLVARPIVEQENPRGIGKSGSRVAFVLSPPRGAKR
jgi:hypothetical protein